MFFSLKTLKNIFTNYTQIIQKITTFVGCFFIYFIGIFLGHIFLKFSKKDKSICWQKHSNKSSLEVMY
ncbi:MAG TPA: hypothetical protein VN174_01680 [Candidatus Methanoperedens sp.]|nr:hypothetical protein [Candidatus Methanoperedens sp.]